MTKRLMVYLAIPIILAVVFYFLATILMVSGVYRLTAMSISGVIAPLFAWMLFPVICWPPLSRRKFGITVGCVFCGYGLAGVLIWLDVSLPYALSGPYGLFNLLLYALLPAVFLELVTRYFPHWIGNAVQ